MNTIVTWMYCSPPGENILHAQVGKFSSSMRVQNYYWRCVFVLFESSNRLNDGARHLLFVNQRPPVEIDGIKTSDLISHFNIEVIEFPTITKSPENYYGSWNTQFIVIDVLDWLSRNVLDDDVILILDSDIVFNKSLDNLFYEELKCHKALLYSIDYSKSHVINGLTKSDLLEIAKDIDPDFSEIEFTYSGGELICCLGSQVEKIAKIARKTYEICIQRYFEEKIKFNEEAHLLSYVYAKMGYSTHTANMFLKRIWTDRSVHSNVDGREKDLVLWHLPAEKKTGFVKMFRSLKLIDGVYAAPAVRAATIYRLEENFVSKLERLTKTFIRWILRRR